MGSPAWQKAGRASSARGRLSAGALRGRAESGSLAEQYAAALLLGVAGALLCAGCGRTLSEDDCRRVGEAMRAAWEAEMKRVGPADAGSSGHASVVLRSEGERLSSEWTSDCKRELAGSEVDPGELDCLRRAKTLDGIRQCAAP
ncbi:hypothetical protein WMF31_16035 [Sorangium sp. So ce1036]|uniref:hypothetical protein n=1 Tax=Sorangium sp. So ce1036 TaxID=3133328 RepID=UPI003F0B8B9C